MKKFLFDMFPVLIFFIVFKIAEMYVPESQALVSKYLAFLISDGKVPESVATVLLATAVMIIATLAQIGFILARGQKVDMMLWLSFGTVSILGGMTIYFHSDAFIKWKPTVLYWTFASAMLIAQFLFKRNMIRVALEAQMQLPEAVWSRLGVAWALFFGVMGVANYYVAFNFSTSTWVNFKLFGGALLMFAFVIAQSIYLSKYIEEENTEEEKKP
jgi:intracellular septation protein